MGLGVRLRVGKLREQKIIERVSWRQGFKVEKKPGVWNEAVWV